MHSCIGTIIRKTYAREQTWRSGSQRSENDRAPRGVTPRIAMTLSEALHLEAKLRGCLKSPANAKRTECGVGFANFLPFFQGKFRQLFEDFLDAHCAV